MVKLSVWMSWMFLIMSHIFLFELRPFINVWSFYIIVIVSVCWLFT